MEPPYLRIARDLRARIADGRLAPGDRVPSTRQLARRWNVALATATKALAELRRGGVVEARPRAGTGGATRPGGRPAARPGGGRAPEGVGRGAPAGADGEGRAPRVKRGGSA